MSDNAPDKIVLEITADNRDFIAKFKDALSKIEDQAQGSFELIAAMFKRLKMTPDIERTKKDFEGVRSAIATELGKLKNLKLDAIGKINTEGISNENRKEAQEVIKATTVTIQQLENRMKAYTTYVSSLERITQAELNNEKISQKEKDKLAADDVKRLKDLGESVYTENEKKMKSSQQARDTDKKSLMDWGKVWQTVFTNVLSILSALGINASFQSFIAFLQDATQKSLEFADAQYNLSVQVSAAQKVLGSAAAGSLAQWQQKIKDLRKELGIYSEQTITKAVTQTSLLTRELGLNKDQQSDLIKVAAALAQTNGEDLSTTVGNLTKVLEGSTRGLRNYGIAINNADIASAAFQLGFTDKLEKTTTGLNSQQVAMATLEAIVKNVNPLYKSLGDYQDSLPGQLKVVNSLLDDQTVKLGQNFQQWQLFADNLKLYFMNVLNDIAGSDAFKAINDMMAWGNQKKNEQRQTGKPPSPYDFGLMTGQGFTENEFSKMDSGKLIDKDRLRADLGIASSPEAQKLFDEAYENYKKAVTAYQQKKMAFDKDLAAKALADQREGERGAVTGTGLSNDEDTSAQEERLKKMDDLTKKYGLEIVDAYKEWQKNQSEALKKKNDDLKKADADELSEIADHKKKLQRNLEDLVIDVLRKRIDLQTKHDRDLADLQSDTNTKRDSIEEDHQKKEIDNTQKYYDQLRDLENQYYFDLRDAVADNDAVAIKRLERKFNLDKSKLDDNLSDQQGQENDSYQQKLADLDQNTVDRKAELDKRYEDELIDLQLSEDRKRQDIALDNQRELDDLQAHFDEVRANIRTEYDNQKADIDNSFEERKQSISDALAGEEDVNLAFLNNLFNIYKDYIGPDGSITQMYKEFYNRQREAQGLQDSNYIPNITQTFDYSQFENQQKPSPSAQLLKIELGLDSDLLTNKIVTTTGDVIQDIVVRRPTAGRTGVQ